MSLEAFQQAVIELTLAPHLARAVRRGNTGVLAAYELTEREHARIVAIAGAPGMRVNCTLARGNRLEIIFEAFPMCCVLLRPVLRAVVDELWAQHRPNHYQLAAEADAFADFVARKLTEHELDIAYLPEVFAYEQACRALMLRARVEPDCAFETVVEFEHPPDRLLPPLAALTPPPPDLPRGAYRTRVTLCDGVFGYEVLSGTP